MFSIPVKSIIIDPITGDSTCFTRMKFFTAKEEWKPFIYDGIDSGWKISSYGRVKNRTGAYARILYDRDGYTRFSFYIPKNDPIFNNGDKPIEKIVKTHRAVAEAFVENDNPMFKTIVMHLNDIPDCNFAVNLKWGTPMENMRDKKLSNRSRYLRGEEKPDSVFKEKDVHFICYHLERGKSYSEIIKEAGYSDMPEAFLKSYRILMANVKKKHCWKYIADQYNF